MALHDPRSNRAARSGTCVARRSVVRGAVPLLLTLGGAAHAGPAGTPDLEGTGPAPIVGGSEVPAGKWPDAVAVLGAQGSCTGTLIAPTVVLTAGHCAEANPTRVIA